MRNFSSFPIAMLATIAIALAVKNVSAQEPGRNDAVGPSSRDATRDQLVPPSAYAKGSPTEETNESLSDDPRRLRLSRSVSNSALETDRPESTRSQDLLSGLSKSSTTTAVAALAFVVGLFFLFAWLVKRGMPRSSRLLPGDAVQVLGRVPLAARQFGHLLKVGNKIVLVSVSSTGIEKLVEIDDPDEVQRLVALCASSRGSSRAEFEDVFGQFAKESTPGGFLGSEAPLSGGRTAADPYDHGRGERRHG